jgi:hypothetical protein
VTPSPPPPSIGFPDSSNTGVPEGASMTVVNGDLSINTSGAVIDGQDIRGCVTVNASNVTIKNTRIACSGSSVLWSGSTGLTVQDSEVACTGGPGTTAVTPQNYTLTRVEVTGCENSTWADRNVTIKDSFIHDLIHYDPIRDPHTDGVQLPSGAANVTVQHSTVYGQYANNDDFGNSAITMGGSMSNISVVDNELAGGGYTLRCNDAGGTSGMTITGNRFSTVLVSTVGGFGPTDGGCRSHSSVYSDNVYLDGPRQGQPVE